MKIENIYHRNVAPTK